MTAKQSVWVLTEAYNDYDQHGEYFVAVFMEKPSVDHLASYLNCTKDYAIHLLNGGGRQAYEYSWSILKQVETK